MMGDIVEEEKHEIENEKDAFEYQVEGFKKFSECILWEHMRRFYALQGIDAWSKGIVPSFITCNSFIANTYAKVIIGYIEDLLRNGDFEVKESIYIIELGAGSGKFSFLLLKRLLELCDLNFGVDNVPFRIKYIMTDFCDAPFSFWQSHFSLRRFLSSGILDFAKFDACSDNELVLENSKEVIGVNSLRNPPIVIANYLFDTLPADAYSMKDGIIHEGYVSVFSKQKESDPYDPEILNRFKPVYKWIPCDINNNSTVQQDSIIKQILGWYQKNLGNNASMMIPVASLSCLERIKNMCSRKRIMVISGDKGVSSTIGLQQSSCEPHIAVHGSFSLMVNFHAIGLWFDALGGFALHCPLEDASLKVSVFVSHDTASVERTTQSWNCFGEPDASRVAAFRRLNVLYHEAVHAFGPDQFFHLQNGDGEMSFLSLVALLNLSDWDADMVFKYREKFLDNLSSCNVRQLSDVRRGLERSWENHFMLEMDKDLAFELGRFFYSIREFKRALVFYNKSTEVAGRHFITEHNIGLCHASIGNKVKALEFFERALELNPEYLKAQERRDMIKQEFMALSNQETISRQISKVKVSIDPELLLRGNFKR